VAKQIIEAVHTLADADAVAAELKLDASDALPLHSQLAANLGKIYLSSVLAQVLSPAGCDLPSLVLHLVVAHPVALSPRR
jgi:hypothetical protein